MIKTNKVKYLGDNEIISQLKTEKSRVRLTRQSPATTLNVLAGLVFFPVNLSRLLSLASLGVCSDSIWCGISCKKCGLTRAPIIHIIDIHIV